MLKASKLTLILGLAGALAGLPSLAGKDPDAAGVAEAIRFEKAKQAAADRQARIEEARGANRADRSASESKAKAVKSASAARKAPAARRNSQ